MRILIDACVLFPTVMREVVLGVAREGAFEPRWTPRILEEWARAAEKSGPEAALQARGEIALLRTAWPDAEAVPNPATESRLWLPDPNDIHVLAGAVDTSSDAVMTLNAKDFPRNILAEEGLVRVDPDGYLTRVFEANPGFVTGPAASVLETARRLSGHPWEMRELMKKARLPRLGKALSR